jgi:hypothetical protein
MTKEPLFQKIGQQNPHDLNNEAAAGQEFDRVTGYSSAGIYDKGFLNHYTAAFR